MRNALIMAALVTMIFAPTVAAAAAPVNAYASMKDARATALADCDRQASAMRFGNRTVQRRNFVKNCMIDRMFYGGIN
jgi:hypothetical protein